MPSNKTPKKRELAALTSNPKKPLDHHNTSINNHHKIIYSALVFKRQCTVDICHGYGIMQSAPLIHKLRDQGYVMDTVSVIEYTSDNIKHFAVAKNVLRGTK